MSKLLLPVSLVVTLISFSLGVSISFSSDYHLEIINEKLSLQAENVPLQKVFRAIEAQSDIEVQFMLNADDYISADIIEIDIEKGLELLLRNFNHSLVYKEERGGGRATISAVYIYSRSGSATNRLFFSSEGKSPQQVVIIQELHDLSGRINLHNPTPLKGFQHAGMAGVDPLMRYETDRPEIEGDSLRADFLPAPQ